MGKSEEQKIMEGINKISRDMHEGFKQVNENFKHFETRLDNIEEEMKTIRGEITEEKDTTRNQIKEIENKMEEDQKEQKAKEHKRNNIIIAGLKRGGEQEERADLKKKVEQVIQNLKLEKEDIKFTRRIGEQMVLVGFYTRTTMELAHARKRTLDENIRIYEDLTVKQREDYEKAKDMAKEKSESGEEYIVVGPRSCPRIIRKTQRYP
jgi:hypothetical protein